MSDKGITDRWADAEKAARLYQVTVEQALAGILWVDAGGRMVHANRAAYVRKVLLRTGFLGGDVS